MPDVNNLTRSWSADIVTAADTIIQAQGGIVAVSSQAAGVGPRGIQLKDGDSLVIKSGVTFRAKAMSNFGVTSLAMEVL